MSLKKGFIDRKLPPISISKRRIYFGVFGGILLALSFYLFLKLIGKSLVVFDAILNNYELIILSNNKQQLFSFFIAFVSVNFAFSVIFTLLIDTPKTFLSKYNYKRKRILNQQRVTNWFFINWFCRLASMFGILALSFEADDFFTDLNFLFYLIIIVFLGQMWINIRPFFQQKKVKHFFIFILSTLFLTLAISKIAIIDNDAINKLLLSKNILYKLNIERITSNNHQNLPQYQRLFFDIYLKENNNKITTKTMFNYGDLKSKSLSEQIYYFKNNLYEMEKSYINYVLFIDKNVKMKYVKNTLNILKKNEGRRIYYSTKDKELPFYVKSTNALGFILNDNKLADIKPNFLKIKILNNGQFYFQNDTLKKEVLKEVILKNISVNGVAPFVFSFHENTSFENYFEALSLSKSIIYQIRNNYTQKGYQQNYSSLPREIKKTIRQEIYWSYIDNMN